MDIVERLRGFCENHIELEYDDVQGVVTEAADEIERLRAALEHYAKIDMWWKEVINSYSGECNFFDWDGELGDEPWEIAEKALKPHQDTKGEG